MTVKLILVTVFVASLFSCSGHRIKGKWDDRQGTLLIIESSGECNIYIGGGPLVGMARKCQYELIKPESYRLWIMDRSGNVEKEIDVIFTFNECGITLVTGDWGTN